MLCLTMADISIILSGLLGAILGVILGSILSYFIRILFENHKTEKRRKFLATLFLNEIKEIKSFIDELRNKEIDDMNIINVNTNGITHSYLNNAKFVDLMKIMDDKPYFTVKCNEPLKKPFEIFNDEIYSFEEPELIRDLILLGKMINIAEKDFFQKYFNENNDPPKKSISDLRYFLSMIKHISNKIDKIQKDGTLNRIAK